MRFAAVFLIPFSIFAQSLELKPADRVSFALPIDSNKASFWWNGEFRIFSSTGLQLISRGPSPFQIAESREVSAIGVPTPFWVESAYLDADGTLFVWYHHEVVDVCGSLSLTTPKIGAAISQDGGFTLTNLGFVLEAGDPPDCEAENGYFAGGHGDFSVIADQPSGYFYFLFGNYGGQLAGQGVAAARLPMDARYSPSGMAWKYFEGQWSEPGRGGRVSPLFPATVEWQRPDTDSFWGPSVHWNSYLNSYVMLLNRSCCLPGWPQEGVYISFNADLAEPYAWTSPVKLLEGGDWYPSVLGLGDGETDSLAGARARLFVREVSEWEMVFSEAGGSLNVVQDGAKLLPGQQIFNRRPGPLVVGRRHPLKP